MGNGSRLKGAMTREIVNGHSLPPGEHQLLLMNEHSVRGRAVNAGINLLLLRESVWR